MGVGKLTTTGKVCSQQQTLPFLFGSVFQLTYLLTYLLTTADLDLQWTTSAYTIITDDDGGDDYDGDSENDEGDNEDDGEIVLQRKEDGEICHDLSLAGPGIPRSVK